MCNIHLFNTEVPESNWIQEIPEYCFKQRSTEVYKSSRYNKPVYIVENHAGAIKAWYEQREGKPALITFDEHTDTKPPLFQYKNNRLGRSEAALLSLLDDIKININEFNPNDLFRKGPILTKAENSTIDKLCYDEQISTAIYLGIISKAYICSPNSDTPQASIESDELLAVYDNIIYLSKLLCCHDYITGKSEDGDMTSYANQLNLYYNQGLHNRLLKKVQEQIFPHTQDYILDIDLDFFSYAFYENLRWTDYTIFFQLLRNARAITIATETECVQNACHFLNSAITSYNNKAQKRNLDTYPQQYWTSHTMLKWVLSLIDFELSGKREKEEAKLKEIGSSQ